MWMLRIKPRSFQGQVLFLFVLFFETVSVCSPGHPGTYSVVQAGLELK